jgi:preprotein translocase subunit SecA
MLEGLDQKDLIQQDYVRDILGGLLDKYASEQTHPEDWDIAGLKNEVFNRFGVDIIVEGVEHEKLNRQELGDAIFDKLVARYDAKEKIIGPEAMRHHERVIMLSVLDQLWKDHLLSMDHLKEGINLRGYGQHDPLVEYKKESFDMFEAMMETFEEQTVRYLYQMQILDEGGNDLLGATHDHPPGSGPTNGNGSGWNGGGDGSQPSRKTAVSTSLDEVEAQFQRRKRRELEQAQLASTLSEGTAVQQLVRGDRVGRNDPCPCGSGKKYKKCCGA